MPIETSMTATLMCTMSPVPSQLAVLPKNRTLAQNQFAATIMDHRPLINILPFGLCMSPANPAVAAATAAKAGVFTPMPCIPATMTPWVTGSPTVLIGNEPALNNTSTCMCMWGGVISILNPYSLTVMEP
jgi:hypothetical protein